jgi:hypothetical protein
LDEQLTFRDHIAKALEKANSVSDIISRFDEVKKGMTGMAVRSLFLTCVRLIFKSRLKCETLESKAKTGTSFEVLGVTA